MKPKIHLCTTSTLVAMFPFYSHEDIDYGIRKPSKGLPGSGLMQQALSLTPSIDGRIKSLLQTYIPQLEAHRRCYTNREKPSELATKDKY